MQFIYIWFIIYNKSKTLNRSDKKKIAFLFRNKIEPRNPRDNVKIDKFI